MMGKGFLGRERVVAISALIGNITSIRIYLRMTLTTAEYFGDIGGEGAGLLEGGRYIFSRHLFTHM